MLAAALELSTLLMGTAAHGGGASKADRAAAAAALDATHPIWSAKDRGASVTWHELGKGFLADCFDARSDNKYLYWIPTQGGVVFQLAYASASNENSSLSIELQARTASLVITKSYEGGDETRRLWSFAQGKPELLEEAEGERELCPPERQQELRPTSLAGLLRPRHIRDMKLRRVTVVRQTIDCKAGKPSITTRKGLVVPIGDEALEVGGAAEDTLAGGQQGARARLKFSLRAQRDDAAKRWRLYLQASDSTLNLATGSDPRTGDHFEIWLASVAPAATCKDAIDPSRICQKTLGPGTKIVVGRSASGKVLVTDEQGAPFPSVAASSDDKLLIVALGDRFNDALAAGVAVMYIDRATGTIVSTADARNGSYGAVEKLPDWNKPLYEEQRVQR